MNTGMIMATLEDMEERVIAQNKAGKKGLRGDARDNWQPIVMDLKDIVPMLFSADTNFPVLYEALKERFNDDAAVDNYQDSDGVKTAWDDHLLGDNNAILELCLMGAGLHNPEQLPELIAKGMHPSLFKKLSEDRAIDGIAAVAHQPIRQLLDAAHAKVTAARSHCKIGILARYERDAEEQGIYQVLPKGHSARRLMPASVVQDILIIHENLLARKGLSKLDHLLISKDALDDVVGDYEFKFRPHVLAHLLSVNQNLDRKASLKLREEILADMKLANCTGLSFALAYKVEKRKGAYYMKPVINAAPDNYQGLLHKRYNWRDKEPEPTPAKHAKMIAAESRMYARLKQYTDLFKGSLKIDFADTITIWDSTGAILYAADEILTERSIAILETPVPPVETISTPQAPEPAVITEASPAAEVKA